MSVTGKASPQGTTNTKQNGWLLSTMDSVLASHPAAPGLILGVLKIFLEKFEFLKLQRFIDSSALLSVCTVHDA